MRGYRFQQRSAGDANNERDARNIKEDLHHLHRLEHALIEATIEVIYEAHEPEILAIIAERLYEPLTLCGETKVESGRRGAVGFALEKLLEILGTAQ